MSFPQMDSSLPRQLIGSEIHGFRTMEDLDFMSMLSEAKARWLRPNEIHAVLTNYKHFNILVKPLTLPASGAIVLFDRKMLRNFRKDGHNWKKKKDGKTVKEAHEHLKVGNEERIHVYYAHGEDNTTFVRRCYWLLDKKLDHIVLVHYRETQESKGAPVTPIYSSPSSALSEPSIWSVSEDSESVVDPASYTNQNSHIQANDSMTITNHVMRLHEINTLEWDDLVVPNDPKNLIPVQHVAGKSSFERQNPYQIDGYGVNDESLSANGLHSTTNFNAEDGLHLDSVAQMISNVHRKDYSGVRTAHTNNPLQSQDSFGRWMSSVISDSPGSVEDTILGSQISTHHELFTSPLMHQPSILGQVFNITDVSPIYALSTEETKILVVGSFYEGQSSHMIKSNLFCVCGSVCVPVEIIQNGVFRCFITPQAPGLVDLFLSFDGNTPISQVMSFEFRAPISSEQKFDFKELQVQMRLAHLLFTTSKILNVVSTKVAPNSLKQAIKFAHKTSHISDTWVQLMKSMENSQLSFPKAKENLFELTLQSRLHEWLLERVVEGCKISERDEQGQGVIHLCAILGYTWAIYPFAWAGLSLDHRDKFGWTALHWAAYYGREKFAAILLSAGAKSYLVTDPTSEKPGGFTAADLASNNDFNGLAAYLAEKALVNHFEDMQIAGNAGGSLQTMTEDTSNTGNVNEEELYLKDSLAAYRTAADAAARIQASFRENSFKMRSKAVRSYNPEEEARGIIAAMKIQHAFRNFEMRKKMAAAVRIQYRFRTWKIRKDFINMRRQTIKIQAAFRGFQSRKTYTRIVWSVGVLEKAILRWRLKRKGFRGLQVESDEVIDKRESDVEEDFFHAGRKQAEERVEGSVVKVQALFRSKKAQEEYRRMKLAHNQAMAEYEGFQNPDTHMGYKT